MNLNDRALLVQLNISQWTARKFDKRATKEVADSNGVDAIVGRYNKSLLPMNDQLDLVHRKANQIRGEFYDNTLPWGIEGTQLLPTSNYLEFMTSFRKKKSEWQWLVTQFTMNYESYINDAKRTLGPLFDANDYPHPDNIDRKFKMDLAVFPVPSNDFRVSIASEELSRIQQDVERRVQEASASAMKDVWQRLYDKVKHIEERLANPSAVFRDTMLENARELCELLPRLNFADDPTLEQMRREVESKLISYHPDALRNDPDLRRDTAAKAKEIMDRMAVFMGQ
jgi:hypothetical protein